MMKRTKKLLDKMLTTDNYWRCLLLSSLTPIRNFLLLVLIMDCLRIVDAHGRMMDPPGRGSMWRLGFNVPENYNDMSNYCGGIVRQWEQNNGKCGVCGDPWDDRPREHEPGGKYATGQIGKTYNEGEDISISIEITANHYGYFEFRLCENNEPMAKVEQECFDKNLLLILNNNEEKVLNGSTKFIVADSPSLNKYKYFVPNKNNGMFEVRARLPPGVSCKYCIMQWRYHAGNNYGQANNGRTCLGCSERQEEFYNCADIEILSDSSRVNLNEFNITDVSSTTPSSALRRCFFSINLSTFLLISLLLYHFN